jgi:hypothetical protein
MCEAELGAQAVGEGTMLETRLWPLRVRDPTQMTLECGCLPNEAAGFKEGDPLSVAQQIGLPVLAAAHAAIARLHSANEPLQVIVGARQSCYGRPNKQMWVHPRQHADEMPETVRIGEWQVATATRHRLPPGHEGLFLEALVAFLAEQRLGLEQPPLARAQRGKVSSIGCA